MKSITIDLSGVDVKDITVYPTTCAKVWSMLGCMRHCENQGAYFDPKRKTSAKRKSKLAWFPPRHGSITTPFKAVGKEIL